MMKEERVLFPYIASIEEAVIQKEPVLPPTFGSVQNPVSMMEPEHDSAGNALYAPYKAPADFEADLHQHIPPGEQHSVSSGHCNGKTH